MICPRIQWKHSISIAFVVGIWQSVSGTQTDVSPRTLFRQQNFNTVDEAYDASIRREIQASPEIYNDELLANVVSTLETARRVTVAPLQTQNSTITVRSFTIPEPVATPVPEAKNMILLEPSFNFIQVERNVSSYVMGALMPLTTRGANSLVGAQWTLSFLCQLSLLNNDFSLLPNTLITYRIQNSDNFATNATRQALVLQQNDVFMIIGPNTDDSGLPVNYLFGPSMVPLISGNIATTSLSNSTRFPSFFRTIPSDYATALAMVQTFLLFNWNWIGTIFVNTAAGTSGRQALTIATEQYAIVVKCSIFFNRDTVSAIWEFAKCIELNKIGVVVIWSPVADVTNVINIIYETTGGRSIVFIANDDWGNPANPINPLSNRLNRQFPLSYLEGSLGFVPAVGDLAQYKSCAAKLGPYSLPYPQFSSLWQETFKCQLNSTEADPNLPVCPSDLNSRNETCLCDGSENFADVLPDRRVNYIADATKSMYLAVDTINDYEKCVPLLGVENCQSKYFTTSQLVHVISKQNFTGLTGQITYGKEPINQSDRRNGTVQIFQFRDNGLSVAVGLWNSSGPFLSRDLLLFSTNPDVPVSFLVPETTVFLSSFWPTFTASLAIIGIVLCLLILAYFTTQRSHPIIKFSGLLWLYLFFGSMIMLFSYIIAYTIKVSNFLCWVMPGLGIFGFGGLVACYAMKTYWYARIVFVNGRRQRDVMSRQTILTIFAMFMLGSTACWFIYLLGNGALPEASVVQSPVDEDYRYEECVNGSTSSTIASFLIILGVGVFVLTIINIVMWVAADMATRNREVKLMSLLTVAMILLSIVMIPLYATVGEFPGSLLQTFLIEALSIIFTLYLGMACIALPRMKAIYDSKKYERELQEKQLASGGNTGEANSPTSTSTASQLSGYRQGLLRRPYQYSSNSKNG